MRRRPVGMLRIAVMDDLDMDRPALPALLADIEARHRRATTQQTWSCAVPPTNRAQLSPLATLPVGQASSRSLVFAAQRLWHGERPGDAGVPRRRMLDAGSEGPDRAHQVGGGSTTRRTDPGPTSCSRCLHADRRPRRADPAQEPRRGPARLADRDQLATDTAARTPGVHGSRTRSAARATSSVDSSAESHAGCPAPRPRRRRRIAWRARRSSSARSTRPTPIPPPGRPQLASPAHVPSPPPGLRRGVEPGSRQAAARAGSASKAARRRPAQPATFTNPVRALYTSFVAALDRRCRALSRARTATP